MDTAAFGQHEGFDDAFFIHDQNANETEHIHMEDREVNTLFR